MPVTARTGRLLELYSRPVMYFILLAFVVGSLLLEYSESILLGGLVLALYAVYLYVSAPARARLTAGLLDMKQSWTTLALVFISLWSFLSAIWSESRVDTLGNSILYFYLLMLYLAMRYEFNEEDHRTGFVAVFIVSILGTMGYLLWQYVNALVSGVTIERELFISTIENSNNLGVISLMFFLFSAALLRKAVSWRRQALFLIMTGLCLLGILSSGSRSGLVVMGLVLAFAIWKYNPRYILILVVLGAVVLTVPELQQRFLDIFSYEQNVQRVKVWRVAGMLFSEKPMLGVGANSFRIGYVRVFEANPQLFNNYDIKVLWHAHNMFMRFAAELGIPGLLGLGLLIAGSVRMMRAITSSPAYQQADSVLMDGVYLAIIAFYLANQLDSYWMSPKPLIVFVFLLGLAGGYARHHRLAS